MLGADLMVRANHRTLEQRPHALYGVRVNVGAHVFLAAVGHGVMGRDLADAVVGVQLVCVDGLHVFTDHVADEADECLRSSVPDDTQPHFASALAAPTTIGLMRW
jgi:hypothetical protein